MIRSAVRTGLRTAFGSSPSLPLPGISNLVAIGDSIAAATSVYYAGPPEQRLFNSYGYAAWAQAYLLGKAPLVDRSTGAYYWGASGQTIQGAISASNLDDIVTRCTPATTALLINAGTNNINAYESASTISGRIDTAIALIKTYGFGAIVWNQIIPRLAGTGEDVRLVVRDAVNTYLATRPGGIICALCAADGEDPGNPGYALASAVDTVAPGHPKAPLASTMGKRIAEALATTAVFTETFLTDASLAAAMNSASAASCYLTGTPVAAGGYGGTGTVPAGWRQSHAAGSAAAYSVEARPDGRTGNVFKVVSATPGTNAESFLYPITNFTTGFTTGDRIRLVCEFYPEAGHAFSRLSASLNFNAGALNTSAADGYGQYAIVTTGQIVAQQDRIVMITPVLTIPASGVTLLQPRLKWHGTGTLRLGYPTLIKV